MAIEKDGRIGLQRQPSGDSSISGRKLSGDTEAASSILQDPTRTNVSSPDTSRSELNRRGPTSSALSQSSLQNSGSPTSAEDSRFALAGQSTAAPIAQSSGSALSALSRSVSGSGGRQEGLADSPQIKQAPRGNRTSSSWRPVEDQATEASEAQPVRDQSKAQAQGSKDPVHDSGDQGGSASNGDTGGSTSVATSLNGVDKNKTSKSVPTSAKSSAPASQPKIAGKTLESTPKRSTTPPPSGKPANEKKQTPSNISPGGFVKPRPKSPTRPIELPSRLTQPTAAAAAKNRNAPPPVHTNRPASRTSMSSSGKGLGRSSSVASRQRPSFGPPPKQPAKDHPVPKKEAKVDEGFLARMMRPTQSSASKVADKVQIPTTPPRRTTPASKKPASAKSGPTRRVVSKTMSATPSATATPETSKKEELSSVKAVAKTAEQTPIAEEAINVAKKAEGNIPLKVSEEKAAAPTPGHGEDAVKMSERTTDTPKLAEKMNSSNGPDKKEDGPKTLERKEDLPELSENSVDFPKRAENEGLPRSSEEKENIPRASAPLWGASEAPKKKDDFSKAPEKEGEGPKPLENTWGLPQSSEPATSLAESSEDREPATKSPKKAQVAPKASDAVFAAFMNPGAEKTDASHANGNRREENTTGLASDSKDDFSSGQPVSQAPGSGLFGAPQAHQEEQEDQEEW